MIDTRIKLKEVLKKEKKLYFKDYSFYELKYTKDQLYYCWKYTVLLRKTEYFHNIRNIFSKFLYFYYRKKKNKLGLKLGLEIWDNSIEEGLMIYHCGNIVINGNSKIGKNCQLHGSNCIGNNGITENSPIIGDNVKIGVGAKIIGGVKIADNVKIGAGAIVVNDCLEEGATLVGIPAKIVK